jgi:hypothetical protein
MAQQRRVRRAALFVAVVIEGVVETNAMHGFTYGEVLSAWLGSCKV